MVTGVKMVKVCDQIEPGNCLIASPMIPMDPNFYRTVILLTDHEEGLGTSGLVLNHPVPEDHRSMMSKLISGSELKSHFLTGGPVGTDQAFCLIDTSGSSTTEIVLPDGRELLPGVHQPSDFEETVEAVSAQHISEDRLHFFRGYSGWEAGQLESELLESVWVMIRTSGDDLLSGARDDLWNRLLNQSSDSNLRVWSQLPHDDRMN